NSPRCSDKLTSRTAATTPRASSFSKAPGSSGSNRNFGRPKTFHKLLTRSTSPTRSHPSRTTRASFRPFPERERRAAEPPARPVSVPPTLVSPAPVSQAPASQDRFRRTGFAGPVPPALVSQAPVPPAPSPLRNCVPVSAYSPASSAAFTRAATSASTHCIHKSSYSLRNQRAASKASPPLSSI